MTIFSVIIALGSVLGLIWTVLEAPGRDRHVYLMAGIWILVGALVSGRVAFVTVHWEYFQDQIIEIPQVWLGGLAWPGALAGGLLSVVLVSRFVGLPLGFLADGTLPLFTSLSVAIWLGCMFAGCAYGPEVEGWWGIPVRDEWGNIKDRLPLQLIMVLLTIMLFWGIERFRYYRQGLTRGIAACLGLGGISLGLLGASFIRADPYPLWNGIRLETWAALFFFGAAILFGIVVVLMSKR